MKTTVWKYIDTMYDDATWPNSDPMVCVQTVWDDRKTALLDLMAGHSEVINAEANPELTEQLWIEGEEFPNCIAMVAAPTVMSRVLRSGIRAIAAKDFDTILDMFESADCQLRTELANVIAMHGLGTNQSRSSRLLLNSVAASFSDSAVDDNLLCYAFQAFAKLDPPSDEMIDLITKYAADPANSQPLRSIAIEALMDIGPTANRSIPVLQQIKESDGDKDLQRFAWAALKSVAAGERLHPCGGTVAEHMRSLGGGDYGTDDE